MLILLLHLAVLTLLTALYLRHRKWKRYYLLVSYKEQGMTLNPPGIRMPERRVYRCTLAGLVDPHRSLPPADAPVLVYPLFMLSGQSGGAKLEKAVAQAYAARGLKPKLFYQPVLGASPWLARAAAEHLRPLLQQESGENGEGKGVCGVLVVAHSSKLPEAPPEPALFCRRLRELLPGTEVALSYFGGQQPDARECLRNMHADHVLLVPFLLTGGIHTSRDLPTERDAAACGKTLRRMPVAAELISSLADRS